MEQARDMLFAWRWRRPPGTTRQLVVNRRRGISRPQPVAGIHLPDETFRLFAGGPAPVARSNGQPAHYNHPVAAMPKTDVAHQRKVVYCDSRFSGTFWNRIARGACRLTGAPIRLPTLGEILWPTMMPVIPFDSTNS